MIRRFLIPFLLLASGIAQAKTVQSVVLPTYGYVQQVGTSITINAPLVTYTDLTTDSTCASAASPGFTWTSPTNAYNLSGGSLVPSGSNAVATWSTTYDPNNGTFFPFGAFSAIGLIHVSCGGVSDTAQVLAQATSTTTHFFMYMTPSPNFYFDIQSSALLAVNVVPNSQVTVGIGFTTSSFGSGNPAQFAVNWTSSDVTKATVDRHGIVTVLPTATAGNFTITATPGGNGLYSNSNFGTDFYGNHAGSNASGVSIWEMTVVVPTQPLLTWWIRPDGGTKAQCDGLHNAAYPGSGSAQPCAYITPRMLWANGTTANSEVWTINSGDTVNIAPNPSGYNLGLDQQSPAFGGSATVPVNCGNPDCYMPTIPSGTTAHHTIIQGTCNLTSTCSTDANKTILLLTWATKNGINVTDSQFVDVIGLDITMPIACGVSNGFTAQCNASSSTMGNYGNDGVIQSAMTSNVLLQDILIFGPGFDCIRGATGVGIVYNRVHLQGCPDAGVNMDDAPYGGLSNISVAGGLTMTNSIIEWSGCATRKGTSLNFPYQECRDQGAGGYADGFGTASTVGTWTFDHVTFRYNFQDGLDLLHANMQNVILTNSQSYGNEGNAYKIGAADTSWVIKGNTALANCNRVATLIGDEPASAIAPGVSPCRAGGGPYALQFSAFGTYLFQSNTTNGYGDVALGYSCSSGSDTCATATTTMVDNVFLDMSNSTQPNGNSASLCALNPDHNDCDGFLSLYPANQGWATRNHNNYYNTRKCPQTVLATETCTLNTNPGTIFTGQPASLNITVESTLDSSPLPFGNSLTGLPMQSPAPNSGSPLLAAGTTGCPSTDLNGVSATSPCVIGALNIPTTPTVATPTSSPAAGTYATTQSVTLSTATPSAVICYTTNGTTPAATTPGTCDGGSTTYSGAITVSTTTTIKALGTLVGDINSSVLTALYTIMPVVATPTASPTAGTYFSTQTVTLSTATSGATICYTIDGSTPTATAGTCTHGTTYSTAISVATTQTIKALGTKSGDTNSSILTAAYTITPAVVATPTTTLTPGAYPPPQTVGFSTATAGSTLCYRTDGVDPTSSPAGTCGSGSTTYSGTLILTTSTTFRVIGTHAGDTDSAVATFAYTITTPPPSNGTLIIGVRILGATIK